MAEETYLGVIPKQCFDSVVFELNVTDFDCWKLLISKALGLGILMGSVLLKAPQIVRIVAAGSTLGLVASGFYLETFAYTSSSIFNLRQGNSFTTWGEVLIIWAQNVVLVLLLWYYTKAKATSVIQALIIFGICCGAMLNIPKEYEFLLMANTMICAALSRMPQIYANFANGHTGVLSPETTFLNVAGGSARVFTTLTEVKQGFGPTFAAAINGVVLNITLLAQIFIYRGETKKQMEMLKKAD